MAFFTRKADALYAITPGWPGEALVLRGIHLAFAYVLILLSYPGRPRDRGRVALHDWALIALTLASIGWLFVNYQYVRTRMFYVDALTGGDLVFGVIFVLVTLEVSRRTLGWIMPATALVFIVSALAGQSLPGMFRHPGFGVGILLDQLYLTTEGIWGIPVGVSATYVILFVVFGVQPGRRRAAAPPDHPRIGVGRREVGHQRLYAQPDLPRTDLRSRSDGEMTRWRDDEVARWRDGEVEAEASASASRSTRRVPHPRSSRR